jgi:hypothetical protein
MRTFRLLCIAVGVLLATPQLALSQESSPASFVRIESGDRNLSTQIADALQRFQRDHKRDGFWIGFTLAIRDGIEFDELYIHDGGGITISRGGRGGVFIDDDDDFNWREERRRRSEAGRVINYKVDELSVFVQLDAKSAEVRRIKASSYPPREKWFRDAPGYWLTDVDSGDSFDYFAALINNPNYNKKIIEPAICLISLHDHPQATPLLAGIAGGDLHFEIRKSAGFWLGQIPGEESFAALLKLFDKEKDHELRENLVFAISQHRSEKVVPQLEKIARSDENFDIREKAIFWLGQTNREDALDILIDLMKGTPSDLKEKIVFSISQHESERAVPLLIEVAESDRDREVRKQAIFWLGQMAGKKTLHALGEIVDSSPETELKEQAVFAISQHGDNDEAFEMLVDIAKNNPNPQVRKKAIFWLSQTDDERALDFFKEILVK